MPNGRGVSLQIIKEGGAGKAVQTRIGKCSKRGGFFSAISIAVMPKDHLKNSLSYNCNPE